MHVRNNILSFKASIQPFNLDFSTIQKKCFEDQKLLVDQIKKQIKLNTGQSFIGVEKGENAVNVEIAQENFLHHLQEYAASIDEENIEQIYKETQQTRFNHLIEIHNNVGVYLPIFFFFPIHIARKYNSFPIFVGSSVKLACELQEIDKILKAKNSMDLGNMDDKFFASEEDIEDYEISYEDLDNFWPKFNYTILDKLIQKSLKQKLPIFIYS